MTDKNLFGKGPREVVYAELSEEFYLGPEQFVIEWGISNFGFGLFTFQMHDDAGMVYVDTECMKHTTVEEVLRHFCDKTDKDKWPEMLLAFDTLENFLKHCVFN